MPDEPSRESLSLQYGRFRAAADGRFAIAVLAFVLIAVVVIYALLW